jgi:hypothetical protein
LRTVIEAACRNPEEGWSRAVACVGAAAQALRTFHDAYERPSRSGSIDQPCVRWYLDFSPKNILVQSEGSGKDEPRIILLDPPEDDRWGSPCEDVGGFCYDMTRICFLPEFLAKRSARQTIDRLKACFIRSYYESTHVASQDYPLREIEAAEYRRASQALIWYTKPWRYDAVMKEVLRLCYLGPLTALYRTRGLPRSYRTVGQLLGKPQ